MEEDNYLLKHTAAIHISNVLTITQRKLVNIRLKHAFHELNMDVTHRVPLSCIMKFLGWSENSEATDLLRKSLKELNIKQIEWNIFNKDRKQVWGVTTLLASVQITNGTVEYSYSKPLRQLLYRPNIYARLDLIVQNNFTNKHALALWEYICEYLCSAKVFEIQTDDITVKNFKRFLGIENHKTYGSFSALNSQIIKVALAEINHKSDIQLKARFKKKDKKVVSLSFAAKRKSQTIEFPNVPQNNTYQHENDRVIADEYIKLGLPKKLVHRHLKAYGMKNIKKALAIVAEHLNSGKKIRTIQGYYVTCLKQGWEKPSSAQQQEEANEQMLTPTVFDGEPYVDERMTLLEKIGPNAYKSWFQDVKFETIDQQKLLVKTPSQFCADYINTNFSHTIVAVWQNAGNTIKILEISS